MGCTGQVLVCRPPQYLGDLREYLSAACSLWDRAQRCSVPRALAPCASPCYASEGFRGCSPSSSCCRRPLPTHPCRICPFPQPQELPMALTGPGALCTCQEAGARLSQLQA